MFILPSRQRFGFENHIHIYHSCTPRQFDSKAVFPVLRRDGLTSRIIFLCLTLTYLSQADDGVLLYQMQVGVSAETLGCYSSSPETEMNWSWPGNR